MQGMPIRCVGIVLCVVPAIAAAQSASRDTSPALSAELLLGAGFPSGDAWHLTPAYVAGFALTPRGSRVSFRLVAESSADETPHRGPSLAPTGWQSLRSDGVQLVGVRTFGSRRLQGYALAGAGIYWRQNRGSDVRYTWADSGRVVVIDSLFTWNIHETLPALIWGGGMSVRIGATHLFGEVKLPLYHNRSFSSGPQAPLIFGIRF